MTATDVDHVCDTCGLPCQGGCRDYRDPYGRPRHGCDDDAACLAAFRSRHVPR